MSALLHTLAKAAVLAEACVAGLQSKSPLESKGHSADSRTLEQLSMYPLTQQS